MKKQNLTERKTKQILELKSKIDHFLIHKFKGSGDVFQLPIGIGLNIVNHLIDVYTGSGWNPHYSFTPPDPRYILHFKPRQMIFPGSERYCFVSVNMNTPRELRADFFGDWPERSIRGNTSLVLNDIISITKQHDVNPIYLVFPFEYPRGIVNKEAVRDYLGTILGKDRVVDFSEYVEAKSGA